MKKCFLFLVLWAGAFAVYTGIIDQVGLAIDVVGGATLMLQVPALMLQIIGKMYLGNAAFCWAGKHIEAIDDAEWRAECARERSAK